jgi:hypothetical protein
MREKLGLTRLEKRPRQFQPTGKHRKKFFIFKSEDNSYWYVLIPTILRTFVRSSAADWYVFDTFEGARAWVSRQLHL